MKNLENFKNIHCIGIGGIGLSAIAHILAKRGYNVSGSDINESEITKSLENAGIKIYKEHKAENLDNVDLLIYSAAINEKNPEFARAIREDIPYASRAEILGVLMDEYKQSIAVCGTHGKTTTTSMISVILEQAKLDPTILVGGNLDHIGGNVRTGESDFFITEACEYKDSFLKFKPMVEVVLNIDEDHLDYFKDLSHITRSFNSFAKNVRTDGMIIANIDDAQVMEAVENTARVITFGKDVDADYRINNESFKNEGMASYDISYKNEYLGTVELALPGEHNIYNSAAAIACTHSMGVSIESIISTLKIVKGSHRRFDVLGRTQENILIIDDYAHHPTEIEETLKATNKIEHNKIWCIFQSHTYTRTKMLLREFAESLLGADHIIIADIYAAREENVDNISGQHLVDEINRINVNKEALFIENFDSITDYICENVSENDIVLTMGAGDIFKVGQDIYSKLKY